MSFYRRGMLLFFFLLLLAMVSAGCTGGQEGRATSLVATVGPAAADSVAPAPSPSSPPPAPTEEPTPEPPDPVMEWVTYRDEQAGLALDYPAFWFQLGPGEENRGEEAYSVTFTPWEPGSPDSEEIPEDASRMVLTVFPSAPPTLQEAAAQHKEALTQRSPPERVVEEERWKLSNALPALRWQVAADGERARVLLTLINRHTVILRGEGRDTQFEEIARTLRPLAPP